MKENKNEKRERFLTHIPEIERKIGYTFRDKSLLVQAFTRTSYCNEHKAGNYQSNEVLEFFGDGVLSLAIITLLLEKKTERYRNGIRTELGEGDFSLIKSHLSDKKNLSECMHSLGLSKYLLMGEGDSKLGIENEPSVMEDLFESIIGAVYVDSGKDLPTVMQVVVNMLDLSVYAEEATLRRKNPKGDLQEWCAHKKRRLPPPEYVTLRETGPDHKKVYVQGVKIGGVLIAEGEGKNTKLADQEAALRALNLLRANEEKIAAGIPLEDIVCDNNCLHSSVKSPNGSDFSQNIDPAPAQTGKKKKVTEAKINGEASQGSPNNNEEKNGKKKPVAKAKRRDPLEVAAALKKHSLKNKLLSPVFKIVESGNNGYKVECRYAGFVTEGSSDSLTDARAIAAEQMLTSLEKNGGKQTAPATTMITPPKMIPAEGKKAKKSAPKKEGAEASSKEPKNSSQPRKIAKGGSGGKANAKPHGSTSAQAPKAKTRKKSNKPSN